MDEEKRGEKPEGDDEDKPEGDKPEGTEEDKPEDTDGATMMRRL